MQGNPKQAVAGRRIEGFLRLKSAAQTPEHRCEIIGELDGFRRRLHLAADPNKKRIVQLSAQTT